MIQETLSQRGTLLVRRLVLEPAEATHWHVDPYYRLTVVVRGAALEIEYGDSGEFGRVDVTAGQTDWDAPNERAHRAVNVGGTTYEEVTIFFLDGPDVIPQPEVLPV